VQKVEVGKGSRADLGVKQRAEKTFRITLQFIASLPACPYERCGGKFATDRGRASHCGTKFEGSLGERRRGGGTNGNWNLVFGEVGDVGH
jgi:hypothetical protein